MRTPFVTSVALLFACALSATASLDTDFQQPPDSAKPHTWWHWMNGQVTKEGITADLEAMKQAGVGGAQLFNVSCQMIPGPATFMGDEWRALMKHAADEAKRLGIELCVHNCAGWSSSGGPWNTPEHSMQVVVSGETLVSGPKKFHGVLPKPFSRLDWYRDIAVLAVRAPAAPAGEGAPEITSSSAKFRSDAIVDGNRETLASLPLPEPGKPQYIQFAFPKPFTARSLTAMPGPGRSSFRGEIQISQDGTAFQTVKAFTLSSARGDAVLGTSFDAVTAPYFRIAFTHASPKSSKISIAEAHFSPEKTLEDWGSKAGYLKYPGPAATDSSSDGALKRSEITDLTAKMKPDGSIDWEVPAGHWCLLRIGHTSTGVPNHPAAEGGEGLECDKLSAAALDAHWDGMMKKILADAGGTGGGFRASLIDSYEVGCQNWTPLFREEFKKRRGYDLLAWLPALTGRVIENDDATERFLWDFRKTIAELFADNYFGHFAELCRRNHLLFYCEPYGNGNFDDIASGLRADIPMSEFWFRQKQRSHINPAPVSAAHTGNKTVIGAESFTEGEPDAGWRDHPYALKALGDAQYCAGINRFIFHRYAMQPWMNRLPGMTMGQNGFHFDRTTTWWEAAPAWTTYLSRCQFLLQRGLFAADVAAFTGEEAPPRLEAPELAPGYAYDHLHPLILARMTVKNGRLALPHGMSYRLLLLPDNTSMTIETARKIRELVSQGAVVLGPKPVRTQGLVGFPASETELKKLTDEVWGNCDGKTVFEHRFGKGRVFWGKNPEEVLSAIDCPPDFTSSNPEDINYIHRTDGGADIYFVAANTDHPSSTECTFRVTGKEPEFFHPDTGVIEPCAVWREANGRTTIPIAFDPAGSVFVVFRNKAGSHLVAMTGGAASPAPADAGLSILSAWYGDPDNETRRLDIADKLRAEIRGGELRVRIDNKFAGRDPAGGVRKIVRIEYERHGKRATAEVEERGVLALSGKADDGTYPSSSVRATPRGFELIAEAPGTYQLTAASGNNTTVTVDSVPPAAPISGSWEARFPPGWNAPERTTFDKLISWPEHKDPGIKYFSGTATYHKKFDLPAGLISERRRLSLDLGNVQVIAWVKLNGRDLGTLWKPPFRADVTGLVRPKGNDLEVRVVNLWPNRLIGDEQFPDDCKFSPSGAIEEWPAWLTNGQPRPEPRRLTFTTWKHWHKEDPPLPSGLLGPVTIVPAEVRPVGLE